MQRSINFSSIFRRKEDQAAPPSDQTDKAALADRLLGRSIKLARGDLSPVSSDSPPVDWDTVDGHITIPGEAIEGMLEGRARVRAARLKSLSPSPLGADTPDQSEYVVSLPPLIPQIQDLFGTGEPALGPEPEYETPFTRNGSVAPRFVTVTSANTISLVSSGQVVLLVSHQGRKLPPGLAQRLTEIAKTLKLVYGKS